MFEKYRDEDPVKLDAVYFTNFIMSKKHMDEFIAAFEAFLKPYLEFMDTYSTCGAYDWRPTYRMPTQSGKTAEEYRKAIRAYWRKENYRNALIKAEDYFREQGIMPTYEQVIQKQNEIFHVLMEQLKDDWAFEGILDNEGN